MRCSISACRRSDWPGCTTPQDVETGQGRQVRDIPQESSDRPHSTPSDPCSASPEISPLRPSPSFTQENGRTLDVAGVGDNRTGTETEYASRRRRSALREDNSPLTVAFEDPVLRAEGLESDRYGDAIKYFELSDKQLHYIVCYCRHGPTMRPKVVAHRVRAAAGPTKRQSFLRGVVPLWIRF